MSNPVKGAGYLMRGFGLIFKPGIRAFVIIPLLINTILFALLIVFGAQQFGDFMDWLMQFVPEWLQWLSWILWIFFGIAGLLIVFFTFSLLANLVGAPFNGFLAEAVEKYLGGEKPEDSGNFWAEFVPSILHEVKKLGYFLAWAIPFLVLFLIPGINLIAPVTWFLFSAWMLALEYGDYPMGNHGLLFPAQRQRIGEKRLLSLGFGSAVSVATMIPVANFIVMPAAVAGATAMWVEQYKSR
jgi:CysZ protein